MVGGGQERFLVPDIYFLPALGEATGFFFFLMATGLLVVGIQRCLIPTIQIRALQEGQRSVEPGSVTPPSPLRYKVRRQMLRGTSCNAMQPVRPCG